MSASLRFPSGLYGITPDWDDPVKLELAVRAAIRGGMTALQLRHKTASPELRKSLALRLLAVCRDHGVVFIVNDDWRLALDIAADGIHLGQHDEDPGIVRSQIGHDMILGVSCYASIERASQLLTHQVSYIAFGAMFNSGTKPQAPPAPASVLSEGKKLVSQANEPRPGVVAIGGITVANAAQLIAAGATSVAVVGGLFLANDIEHTAREFSSLFS